MIHIILQLNSSQQADSVIGLGPAYASSWLIAGRRNHRDGGRYGEPRLVPGQIDPVRRKDD
jgi:hypothetical protein